MSSSIPVTFTSTNPLLNEAVDAITKHDAQRLRAALDEGLSPNQAVYRTGDAYIRVHDSERDTGAEREVGALEETLYTVAIDSGFTEGLRILVEEYYADTGQCFGGRSDNPPTINKQVVITPPNTFVKPDKIQSYSIRSSVELLAQRNDAEMAGIMYRNVELEGNNTGSFMGSCLKHDADKVAQGLHSAGMVFTADWVLRSVEQSKGKLLRYLLSAESGLEYDAGDIRDWTARTTEPATQKILREGWSARRQAVAEAAKQAQEAAEAAAAHSAEVRENFQQRVSGRGQPRAGASASSGLSQLAEGAQVKEAFVAAMMAKFPKLTQSLTPDELNGMFKAAYDAMADHPDWVEKERQQAPRPVAALG